SDELGTIRDLNHENIIKIVKKEKVRNGIWFLFFPYYTPIINEDENDARISIMFETFGELFDTCIQICNAILYIHSKKVIHNDIKLSNLVYNEETKQIIVIDFDCAVWFYSE